MRHLMLVALLLCTATGCFRPVEPVKLETIGTNEEGFLIPLTGDSKKQTATAGEDFLRQNLVLTKQVRIPQQWVQTGRLDWTGDWRDSATLIKVDRSPVTREWTADPNSGTSKRNEALWVMTSDQVEFSTGWTITARIATRDDAVRFLYNYPNGTLQNVLDGEVRARLQAIFGLEVTDLPMDKLRKAATPHIHHTVKDITDFFAVRGITVTTLGITGGFIYKEPLIQQRMVEVFIAEQQTAIALAETSAQTERNNKINLEAVAKANAILTERKAEAEGLNAVAQIRQKEVEMAKANPEAYIILKRLEIEREKLQRWNGAFPTYYLGSTGQGPDMLLQVPAFAANGEKK